MKIVVVGTGYVGLVTGVCLATRGHDVVCVDKDKNIIKKINNNIDTIFENYLANYLNEAIKNKALKADNELEKNLRGTDIVLICVGTPTENGEINLDIDGKGFVIKSGLCITFSENNQNVIVKSINAPIDLLVCSFKINKKDNQ